MNKKGSACRWLGFVLAIALALCPLGTVSAQRTAESEAGTEKPGVLVVGMEADSAPFNWSQGNDRDGAWPLHNSPGEYVNGYDVVMSKRIADHLGMELEIVKIEWDGLLPALLSGKIDAIIAGMSPTEERQKEIDFTDSYYRVDLVLVVRKDSRFVGATSLADFSGAKISAQLNTYLYDAIDQIPGVEKLNAMDSYSTMVTAVKSGKVEAFVAEKPGAMAAATGNEDLTYIEFDQGKGFQSADSDITVAIGVRKGSPLGASINGALKAISEEDRQTAMADMVELNTGANKQQSFWESVVEILNNYLPLLLRGAGVTLFISVVSTAIGFVIGMAVQIVRSMPTHKKQNPAKRVLLHVVKFLLTAYVEIIRGTPMMVQAIMIFYGGKMLFNIDFGQITAGLLVVSINTGAYLAEAIRGGIASVDVEQMEACKAIGLTHSQSMRYVILPQTIKAIIPSIGNELVNNIKDTTVLNVISVSELFFVTRSVSGTTFKVFQAFLISSVIYFILTFTATRIINWIGRRATEVKPFKLVESQKGAQ